MFDMKVLGNIGLIASQCMTCSLMADEQHDGSVLEEVIVSAPFQRTAAETTLPVGVLSGETLQEKVANSIGETLQDEIGVANASFGAAVGHPVIRGQSGNRVQVLQNGAGVTDAANVSPDHANGVDALTAERIEIIRGPSTLLFGSGAIGGVVNVIDNRIPSKLADGPEFLFQQSYDSVSNEKKSVAMLDLSGGGLAFHLDGFVRRNDDVDIPGLAIESEALERLESLNHHEDDEDHDDHEDETEENTRGFVGNSAGEASNISAGVSLIGDQGFIGFSVSRLTNDYGLPPGVHEHGEHDDHDGESDDHDDESHEDVEFIDIELRKTRYDLKAEYRPENSVVRSLRFSAGFTDYEHGEIEIFSDRHRVTGTTYENDGIEGRAVVELNRSGSWSTVVGTQFADTEFLASGEEAFIPETDVESVGVFTISNYQGEKFDFEAGFRLEKNRLRASGGCNRSDTTHSIGASLLHELSSGSNLLLGLSRSERAPSVEESFSNISKRTCLRKADDEDLVFHAATNLLEVGDANLDTEVSQNIELGVRHQSERISGEISVYLNDVDDYVFLDVTSDEFADQSIASYTGRDARFTGIEARMDLSVIEKPNANLNLTVFGDHVRGVFIDGGKLPRLTPAKVGVGLRLFGERWNTHLHVTRVFEQEDVGNRELPTDGYTRLSLRGDYHWGLPGGGEVLAFVQAANLLDEEIRNHSSLLKHFAPEPGRNIRIGLRFTY